MVAIRGNKTKGTAKPKAAKAKAKASSSKEADVASIVNLKLQQRYQKDEFLALMRFALQSNLAVRGSLKQSVPSVCNALLVAFCANGKEKTRTPSQILSKLSRTERQRVCGAIFSADEIAYSCRNCQQDTTCVMCKDCYTHSKHVGHDVYFQRTTAGSSCDCGDVHAWKQSGFCSRHCGESKQSGPQAPTLPKGIRGTAAIVIDTVVEHIYQVLLGINDGFELAEAMELFTRDIPPSLFPIQAHPDGADVSENRGNVGPSRTRSVAGRTRVTRLSAQFSAEPGSRSIGPGGRLEAQATEVTRKGDDSSNNSVLFNIRLHNDDVHSMNEVINHLYVELSISKQQARTLVSHVDAQGDATIATKSLLQCPGIIGNLMRRSLNISVAPTWLEKQTEGLPALLEWLQSVSSVSDGLRELVSEALQRQRAHVLGFVPAPNLPQGKTLEKFLKERHIRLHSRALDVLMTLIPEEKDVSAWAHEQAIALEKIFDFSGETRTTSGFLAQGNRVSCKNVFIEDFVKAISLSPSFHCYKSVRKSFDAVVAKYFTLEQAKDSYTSSPSFSVLTLLTRYDCALRKGALERSHALLREHLVTNQFRASMLEAYLRSYAFITNMFLRGLGNSSESIFDFAVQFLTVPPLVRKYTKRKVAAHPGRLELVREILCALNTVFQAAVDKKEGTLNADHAALSSQKYRHCMENLEYVLNTGTFSSELVCNVDNLKLWLSCLTILQGADLQVRRGSHQNHVEYESDSWLAFFNLGIRVHALFAVCWNGIRPSQLDVPEVEVAELFGPILNATLSSSMQLNEKVAKKTLCSVVKLTSMSKCSVERQDRSISTYDFNVSSQPTSLHLPLHRFLAAAVRHICISSFGLGSHLASDSLLRVIGVDNVPVEKQLELVEMPLRCLVMAAQIHSNMWRRNGDENMVAQLYNYSALPYCIHYRDADILILQLGILMNGPDVLVARMVDRFQLGRYFALWKDRPPHFVGAKYWMIQCGYTGVEEGIDEKQSLQMLEEFLRLVIILGASLPSSTGTAYDEEFLKEELLQQLCAKSLPFSKLMDLAVFPSGHDDIPATRVESVLASVSNFVPPSGLEPGRYELKEGLMGQYNPYFLHLNREAHELARDRWTTYRTKFRKQLKKSSPTTPPNEPLKAVKRPLECLRPVEAILTCESILAIIQSILSLVVRPTSEGVDNSISDAVVSTCLHLLVHAVHTASSSDDIEFWTRLSHANGPSADVCVVQLLSQLLEQSKELLDSEQTGTVEWLMWKIAAESLVCKKEFEQAVTAAKDQHKKLKALPLLGCGVVDAGASPPLTLEQRKVEARRKAMAAMAQRQAAFQAMVDDEAKAQVNKDPLIGELEVDSLLEKRKTAVEGKREATDKRQKVETERCSPRCILCHDTTTPDRMGMAAYVHQSTVLAPGFRPEPNEALGLHGQKVRTHVKAVIEAMELCSSGSPTSFDLKHAPPALHALAYAVASSDWYMENSLNNELSTRERTGNASPRGLVSRRPRTDRIRFGNGNMPMLEGEPLQTADELEVLEGVLDLREEQQVLPADMRGAVRWDVQEPRRVGAGARGAGNPIRGHHVRMMYDSDDDDITFLERFPPGFGRAYPSAKLYLTPCGLHIRTCHHVVHIQCLERYITSLHDKAMRGEEFDGVQAIDPDSAMMQFLCPLCKTLSNFLIPLVEPCLSREEFEPRSAPSEADETVESWDKIVIDQLAMPGWTRSVLGCANRVADDDQDTEHDLWRDYFEDSLWEPHGSLEKGAPFLWSACAFTVASFLTVADECCPKGSAMFDPLIEACPPSLEKELESLMAVTKFCRWTFSLLEHSADAKVILETAKRCCPIHTETKREARNSIDACLRGTIRGLLLADTFTAFVVSSVIAYDLETIWRFMPVFTAADLLQRVHAEFFETRPVEVSLFLDKDSTLSTKTTDKWIGCVEEEKGSPTTRTLRRTRSGRVLDEMVPEPSCTTAQRLLETLKAWDGKDAEAYAAVQLVARLAQTSPSEKLQPLSSIHDVRARLARLFPLHTCFVRRMKLFWRCLAPKRTRTLHVPSLVEISRSPDATFEQIWRWCVDRNANKMFLACAMPGDKCEHTEGCCEAYVASMFILREGTRRPRLIELPLQYDELYSSMTGRHCTRCMKTPCDPGLCLICGDYLCCGDSCCTLASMPHGSPVGECTRHAAECGGGVGIVLLLERCRVALVGGSMAAYFPSVYVDSHGEEDVGLQRGRPLRLDRARYAHLESLWRTHRIFTEVSRLRNQRDPQSTINLSHL
ncbi:hypothetical protein PsorP6_004357 [Peronosclerospora sorghi]|uniref:Uncharacterized protein n=1 Tax=Peronosclerospora sorghi TaxID=230839 RepID=A0ACC0VRD3_9STRA|nr:hypothetical protein PsorP6_004357 [Peronosclerospora sorghi]